MSFKLGDGAVYASKKIILDCLNISCDGDERMCYAFTHNKIRMNVVFLNNSLLANTKPESFEMYEESALEEFQLKNSIDYTETNTNFPIVVFLCDGEDSRYCYCGIFRKTVNDKYVNFIDNCIKANTEEDLVSFRKEFSKKLRILKIKLNI